MWIISSLSCFAGLVALIAPCAHAQSEIDPDHFESPNTKPFLQPKPSADGQVADRRYEGILSLPYSILCSGKKLAPGEYTISLRSDGKVGQATLSLNGKAIGIACVVHQQAHRHDDHALIVDDKGKIRTLSVIHVAELAFIFDSNHKSDSSSKSKPKRAQRLPSFYCRAKELRDESASKSVLRLVIVAAAGLFWGVPITQRENNLCTTSSSSAPAARGRRWQCSSPSRVPTSC